MQSTHTRIAWISGALVFFLLAILFAGAGKYMFFDGDPLWHLLSGDLIRAQGAIPYSDSWSYTAGDYRWYNMSWLWDVSYSFAHAQLGWHGVIALNGLLLAATFTCIYLHCLLRSGDGIAAFITVLLAAMMLPLFLRPMQISYLMIAFWMLVLSQVARGHVRKCWLALLPFTMLLWVNMHGGAMLAPLLLGTYFLHAVWQKDRSLIVALVITGIAVLLAMLCNPYGIYIVEAAARSLNSAAKPIITEWMSFSAKPGELLSSLFLVLFILMVPRRNIPIILPAERWLAYALLLMALISVRHMHVFTIIAAPLLACALQPAMKPKHAPTPLALKIRTTTLQFVTKPFALASSLIACVALAIWLPSPLAARVYAQNHELFPSLAAEIDYLRTHYPKVHILNHYSVGGLLLYQADTQIPVFIDERADTAYPREVVQAYVDFIEAKPGWEAMLDDYAIGTIILSNRDLKTIDRIKFRCDWREVFVGPHATIFARQNE